MQFRQGCLVYLLGNRIEIVQAGSQTEGQKSENSSRGASSIEKEFVHSEGPKMRFRQGALAHFMMNRIEI